MIMNLTITTMTWEVHLILVMNSMNQKDVDHNACSPIPIESYEKIPVRHTMNQEKGSGFC